MKIHHDDPNKDEIWSGHRRAQVRAHLKNERIAHTELSDWPAWQIAPIVSVWPIRSESAPAQIAMWVICGDVPTDTISADSAKTPREAVRTFARRLHDAAAQMANAEPSKKNPANKSDRAHELALFLEVRARQLVDWTNDDSLWDVDDL